MICIEIFLVNVTMDVNMQDELGGLMISTGSKNDILLI